MRFDRSAGLRRSAINAYRSDRTGSEWVLLLDGANVSDVEPGIVEIILAEHSSEGDTPQSQRCRQAVPASIEWTKQHRCPSVNESRRPVLESKPAFENGGLSSPIAREAPFKCGIGNAVGQCIQGAAVAHGRPRNAYLILRVCTRDVLLTLCYRI
jgi:hypothetical protein